jgi:hypothetical protein
MKTQPVFKRSEQGQVLVIMILVLVGLLAFAALTVDAGMLYFDRRQAQNGADSAALAGAGRAGSLMDKNAILYENFNCNSGGMVMTTIAQAARDYGIQYANNNHFTITADTSTTDAGLQGKTDYVNIKCVNLNLGGYYDRYLDIRIKVTTQTKTAFAQMFFSDKLLSTVEAIARVYPRTKMQYGYAIVSLGTQCGQNTGGVYLDGTIDTTVNGGGIYSNSCLIKNGNSGIVTISNGGAYARTSVSYQSGTINPPPSVLPAGSPPMPRFEVPAPDCASVPNQGDSNGGNLVPGRYGNITIAQDTVFAPGLYCVSGTIKDNGHQLISVSGTDDQGITIYLTDSGDISLTGSEVRIRAPKIDMPPAIKGMLIYMAAGSDNLIELTGNNNSFTRGTIYAPDGKIDIGGNADVPYATQLVGKVVKTHGSVNLVVNFEDSYPWIRLPQLMLNK